MGGLPSSMSNIWLKHIFKNDGEVIDAFVSKKMRKNKPFNFGFVRFARENESYRATREIMALK